MKPTVRSAGRAVIVAAVVIAVIGGVVWGFQRFKGRGAAVRYITRAVGYADIAAAVNETGTVNPVDVVLVGSQVSGTIATLKVDFNSKVTKGEVLATLDPTNFQAAVDQAIANLAATQASAAATQSAVQQAQAGIQTASSTLQQMQAAVETASANLQQAQANLRSTQAGVTKVRAQVALANLTVSRDESLLRQGFIPQNQLDTDRTAAATNAEDYRAAVAAVGVAQAQVNAATSQLRSAQAQVNASASQLRSAQAQVVTAQAQAAASQHQITSAAAQVQQARYNLSRTVITSPVDGVVMARNISVGQTVAASFQTPTLFTLATNLTDMQVDTSVDEADVGNVRTGESAHISVTAFPNVVFAGTVQQVRVNPTVIQNVVTYDAVVIVHDTSGRLLPGMTAQVTIDVGKRTHVLAVPTSALLYRPLGAGGPSASSGSAPAGPSGSAPAAPPVAGAPGSQVTVWVLSAGRPKPVSVVIGLSDGQNVEIASGNLRAGDPVIIAQTRARTNGSSGVVPGGGGLGAGGPGR